jgi:Ca-activated chloride channel family protein
MRYLLAFLVAVGLAAPASAIGLLVPTDPGTPALALLNHRVDVKVKERGATTHVDMTFQNPTNRQLEATFLFPMPKGATVDELALWMNGKREVGAVMERQKARQIYESIVRRSRDPGLIEYVDSELVEIRVFPIPANGTQRIELTYSHLVDYDGGLFRYSYPMKTDQQATSTLQDFTFNLHLDGRAPLKNLYSPTHTLAARRRDNSGDASLEKNNFSLANDLRVFWSVDDKDVGISVLTYKAGDEPGYYMLLASPRDDVRDREIIGKRVAFVVDTSGSMEGTKMAAVREALAQVLGKLGEDDLFSIVSFGGYAEAWKPKMVSASKANVGEAQRFVRGLEPLGGTNIGEALEVAFSTATGSEKAPLMVVFLTDGRPTIGDTDTAQLVQLAEQQRSAKAARLFVLGVGDDLNTILLDKLAGNNGGSALYLKAGSGLKDEVEAFYERISHPVLADVSVNIDGVSTFGALPRALGDLFRGQQLVVVGRYRNAGKAKVTLTGQTPKGPRSFTADVEFADRNTEHPFVARLWAQRQVGMLLDEIRQKGEQRGLVDEVTQLATRFGIVTPYTSYLVLEPGAATRPDDMPPPPPRPMPMASEAEGWFGPRDDAAPAAAAPAKRAEEMERKAAKAKDSLRVDGGASGVAAAKEIAKLKGDTATRQATTTTQQALGRAFTFADGFFVDVNSKVSDKTLTVQAYSEAWFAVLRVRPELKAALALGEQVKVSVGSGRTLVVTTAKVTADEAAVKAFLAR